VRGGALSARVLPAKRSASLGGGAGQQEEDMGQEQHVVVVVGMRTP